MYGYFAGQKRTTMVDAFIARMALEKDQLRSGTRSVGEIALAIGFQSSSAFTTAFTRIVGCPPTQFLAERPGGLFSEEAS
jgi:AraC-like DNA-binding protein